MSDRHTFEIEIDGTRDVLTRLHPSALSVMYASPTAWYRVFPSDIPLKWKTELRGQLNQRRTGCVSSVRFWQHDETGWYVLQYEKETGSYLLTEAIESGDVLSGLEGIAAALRALPVWWSQRQAPLLPMPGDIVVNARNEALWLPSPLFRLPTVAELFAEPERTAFLAPELFRGAINGDLRAGQAQDLYALGVALLSCFFWAEKMQADEVLLRAATGLISRQSRWRESAPFWIEQVEPTKPAIALGRQLAANVSAERLSLNLPQAADYLSNCRRRMEPLNAVREVRATDPRKAFALLESLLLEHESYQLLVEGANLAEQLGNDLQALRLYQRGVEVAPNRPECYRNRFDLIAGMHQSSSSMLRVHYEQDLEFSTRLDGDMHRDFEALARLEPKLADQREVTLARHYLNRGKKITTRYQSVLDFIHRRLQDPAAARSPAKLELRLLEPEVLLEQGLKNAAATAFNEIVADIERWSQVKNPLVNKAAVRRAAELAGQLRTRFVLASDPVEETP